MPSFINRTSIPANSALNVVAGSLYEYAPFNARINFSMVQETGAVGAILATVNSGPDTLLEEGPISAAARFPVDPDDFFLDDEVAQGDRVKVNLRNTTAGAIVVTTVLKITPL